MMFARPNSISHKSNVITLRIAGSGSWPSFTCRKTSKPLYCCMTAKGITPVLDLTDESRSTFLTMALKVPALQLQAIGTFLKKSLNYQTHQDSAHKHS